MNFMIYYQKEVRFWVVGPFFDQKKPPGTAGAQGPDPVRALSG
jgi:hypothetical protein